MRGFHPADGDGRDNDGPVGVSRRDGTYLVPNDLLGLLCDLAPNKKKGKDGMTAFTKFMAKIPTEYVPRIEAAISRAVAVLADPAATDAQYQAVADELESLQKKIGFDSAKAAADAWKEAIQAKLKAQYAGRLIDQGLAPQQASKEASKLLTPDVNRLLKMMEKTRTCGPKLWKFAAGTIGAIGLLSLAIYNGVRMGTGASGTAADLVRKGDEAKQMQEFWDRQREFDQALNGIEVSGDDFQRMTNIVAPQAVAIQPATIQPLQQIPAARTQDPPAAVAAIPEAVARQPLELTITKPNQPPQYAQSTVGTFVSALPSPQREQTAEVITKQADYESRVGQSISTRHIPERHFTIEARDGSGQIFGKYSQ